jgi:DNA-binding CsgD family transcriptional regulator
MGSGARLLARTVELDHIGGFLAEVPHGASAILLSGVAGIGKTTLVEWAIEQASTLGWRVLHARASAAETTMSFAALADLLEPAMDDVVGELPEVQRSALDAALLRAGPDASTPDQRAVSMAVLGSLRALARAAPVLLAVDDLPWLDAPTADALRFAVRRLRDEPIGLIASARLGEGGDLPELVRTFPGARRLVVGPMSSHDLGRIIRDRLDAELPRPVTDRIHLAAEGNPLFALEIARELVRTGVPEVGAALPVPADVRHLLRARLSALPPATRRLLVLAAASARPTEALLAGVVTGPVHGDPLAPALEAKIVSVEGDQIRFTHPLLASTVYASASVSDRRDAHRLLAAHVENDEERARHLALASPGPDAEVAAVVEDAAAVAASRGAPQSAAQLSALALRLTPPTDPEESIRRTAETASYLFDAGDDAGARTHLEAAIAAAGAGDERARLLCRLAAISWMDMDRVSELCERALDQPGSDPGVAAKAHGDLAWVGIYRGDLAAATHHARASRERAADETVEATVRADCLSTSGIVEALHGRPAEPWMAEAARLHDVAMRESSGTSSTVFTAAPTCHGLQLLWAGELAAAREVLERQLHAYEARGQFIVRDEVLGYLAEVECRAGNYELAQRYAREGQDIDEESGRSSSRGHQLFPTALVAAHRGRVAQATSEAEEGLRLCLDSDDRLDANCHRYVLGFVALSTADPAAALRHLEPAVAFLDALGSPEPGIIPCVPDAVEALVALGRVDDADVLVDRLQEQGRSLDRPWARAMALRCRGLVQGHRRDQRGASAAFERALEEHDRVPQPFDRARTLLVKGEVERRAKQKAAARRSLEQAVGVFDELGSPLWAARGLRELDRIGGRPPSPTHLTATERQVAELVADGRTNAEVAGLLFMSVHTVRSNLRRIYGKLAVRNRGELAASLRSQHAPEGHAPHQ